MSNRTQLADSTELDLIFSARHGDKRAFGELVGRYQSKVINIVYRICGDPELAQDIAQDTFIRAWQKLHQYDTQRAFQNWLYRIATNNAIDRLRQAKQTDDIEELSLQSKDSNPEETLEIKQKVEMIRLAVLNLPPASRTVLVLREYEGLTYQEISDTLQIPVGTVMSRLNFARNHLRQALQATMEAE